MIKEIRHPYNELTDIERERIEEFRGYHMADYNQVYVYYVTDLNLGVGYDIIISLRQINNPLHINFDDITKNITDEEYLVDHI